MGKFRELLSFQAGFRSFLGIGLGGVLLLCWLMLTPAAKAAPCHSVNNQTVCLVEIKRSAKYPWEYRVTLSQDGVKQPQEIYNCRDRVRVGVDRAAAPFGISDRIDNQTDENGEWICRLVKRI